MPGCFSISRLVDDADDIAALLLGSGLFSELLRGREVLEREVGVPSEELRVEWIEIVTSGEARSSPSSLAYHSIISVL